VAERHKRLSCANRRFEFYKSGQLFIGARNEALALIAMCVCIQIVSPVGINR
jgi:hypothetical protein